MDATVRAIAVIEGAGAWLGRGKYLVVVGDSSSRLEPQTFSPSVFRGADRVDLEDVLEFGGYDTIAVRPRRGKFAAAEAGRILREVVLEDITFDHRHFFVLAAGPRLLVIRKLHDLAPPRPKPGMLLHAVLGILELCGCEPRKGRSFGRGAVTEVEFSVDGAPSALCVPRTPKAASLRPELLERLRGRTVLLPWRLEELEPGAAAAGVQLVPAWRFLRALHEARIRTIELELAKPRRKPAVGDRRPGRRGRG